MSTDSNQNDGEENIIDSMDIDIALSSEYSYLPEDIQYFLQDDSFEALFEDIISSNSLDTREANAVKIVAFGVLIGEIKPTEFVDSLSKAMGINRNKAALLAQEINRDIFNPVKDSLKIVHGLSTGTKATEPAPTEAVRQSIPPSEKPIIPSMQSEEQKTTPQNTPVSWSGAKTFEPSISSDMQLRGLTSPEPTLNTAASVPPQKTPQEAQKTTMGSDQNMSVFEQKLGGTFKVSAEVNQLNTPTTSQVSEQDSKTVSSDPYRELPI